MMLGKALNAQFGRQRRQPVLRRPDPLSTQIDRLAAQRLAQRPPPDAIAGFNHDARLPATHQFARRT